MIGPAVHICAEDAAQILMEGAQELLGVESNQQWSLDRLPKCVEGSKNGRARAFLLQETGGLLSRLEETYGPRGSQGLALRIGRAVFRYGLNRLGESAGFYDVEFRLLPAPRRMESGLRKLAGALSNLTGEEITVEKTMTGWLWKAAPHTPNAGGHVCASCYLIAGLLQGFMSWAGGGRYYPVREIACRADGSPNCVFQIDSKPVD